MVGLIILRQADRDIVSGYYDGRLKTYGHDVRSLGWTPGGRRARFGALTSIGDLQGCSVLDVGCGFGDLYGYLAGKGVTVDYTGVDISPDFVAIARETYPDARFIVADYEEDGVGGPYDWAFAAGLFTLRLSDSLSFVRQVLRRMFDVCRKGFAVDFLCPAYGDGSTDAYWRCRPEEMLGLCRTLSKRVALRCDYMVDEFCVYVYKDEAADERNIYDAFEKAVSR